MTEKQEDDIRARMIEFLPEALEKAIKHYHKYAEIQDTAKNYREAQSACKTALGHMAGLVVLAERLREEVDGVSSDRLDELIACAQRELEQVQNE